jgi:hypothetical protein
MKEIKFTILYCVFVRNFVIQFYYGSGSDFLTSYGSGSTRQKVTVPTLPVPVPQHCLQVEGEDVLLVELTGRTGALINDLVHYSALRLGQQFYVVFRDVANLCTNSHQPPQNTVLGRASVSITDPDSGQGKNDPQNRKS